MASLRSLVETALSAAFESISTASILPGQDDGDKSLPCIIVRAVSAEEIAPNMGNYNVTCSITVKALASDTTFDATCQSVRTLIATTDFVSALNITGLKVWGVASPDRIEWGNDGDAVTETRTIEIACAPFAFPA